MLRKLTLGVRAHDAGLESLPSFYSYEAVKILAERVSSRHFSAVQFTMTDTFRAVKPGHLNQGLARELRNAFDNCGVQIAVLSCYINLVHPDREEQKKELDCFHRYLEFCRDLGCNYVATETGSRNTDYSFHPDNHGLKAMNELLDNLGQMVTWASDFGVSVAIEGVSKFPASSPKIIREILDQIKSANLRVILDPVNLLELSADNNINRQCINIAEESFDLYGDDIIAIHLKDCRIEDGKIINVPIGTGSVPFDFLLKLAAERKPALPVIMEEQNPQDLEKSVSFIEELANSLV